MFTLKTSILQFDTFKAFAQAENLGEGDLVITQSFIHEPFMQALGLPCTYVMQDRYGAGEPSDEMIDRILQDNAGKAFRRVVGIGGGTVIDIAKLLVIEQLSRAADAFERKIPITKGKELILVPTTCGTGSEVTNISIAEIKAKHTKMGLADDALAADKAVLIPELLKGLPYKFFLFSAIDALIHAVESFVSPKADDYSRLFSEAAIRTILRVFRRIAAEGEACRFQHSREMLLASNYAGIAFGNAGCGAVHALSYPIGGKLHVAHGEANYQFFVPIFQRYARKNPDGAIVQLHTILAAELGVDSGLILRKANAVYDRLSDLLAQLLNRRPLREFGMQEEDIESFADNVVRTQQRLLNNNYVAFSRDEIRDIYKELY